MSAVRLVVNADDLGLSAGVNEGVVRAHVDGVVTSASVMVHGAGAADVADIGASLPRLSLGLHIDLGEWSKGPDGWFAEYERVDVGDLAAVEREVASQLAAFERLVGRAPTHLDSHQHVHREGPVADVVSALGRRLGVPVRGDGHARYCGDFYGQWEPGVARPQCVSADALAGIIRCLPRGLTELACHPATRPDMAGMYRAERVLELAALCDPAVVGAIEEAGVQLTAFGHGVRVERSQPKRPDT